MGSKLSPRSGIVIMTAASTAFAANHVCARVAFDHGASVATGVLIRAAGTALVLFVFMKIQRVPLVVPRALRVPAFITGAMIAVQSYCLYSAVALIPVALALLVFQTAPMLYILLSWATGKDIPRMSALLAIPVALAGLATALGISVEGFAARWAELGKGLTWAIGGAIAYALVLYLNANKLKAIDGRVRTFIMTAVMSAVVLAVGASVHALASPWDTQGWVGIALLTAFYGIATCAVFISLPRVPASATVALNFEPIALLFLGWIFLGQAVNPLQIFGALVTVGAIAWMAYVPQIAGSPR
jgi:drug/metabolite transporter (DMT)-like permease